MVSPWAVTPYRATHVRIDVSETVLREPIFGNYRTAAQMARANQVSKNVHYLETGAWALEPIQQDLSNLHQKTDTLGMIQPAAAFDLVTGMIEKNLWRKPTDLPGVTVGPGVSDTGDPFIYKTVAAGTTWAQSKDADIAAFGQIVYRSHNVTVDRVGVGKTSFPANQGFVIRVVINAFAPHSHDFEGSVYFGGPADINGTGIYALALLGNGEMHLYDRSPDPDHPGQFLFNLADYWEGFPRSQGTQVVVVRVWPHIDANGYPTIEFRTETTNSNAAGGSVFQPLSSVPTNPRAHVWRGIKRYGTPNVTGPGPARIDLPRDKRTPVQISVLRFQPNGLLIDDIFAVPFYPSVGSLLTLIWNSSVPTGTSLTGRLYNATDNSELTQTDGGDNYRVYEIPAGDYHYYAQFEFTSDAGQTKTALLYNYKVQREGATDWEARSEIDVGAVGAFARDFSITGPEKDATHETASFAIEDVAAVLPLLSNRARIHTVVETQYDPAHTDRRSVLFEGYIDRSDGLRKGAVTREGLSAQGAVRVWPSPDWKGYTCTLNGMWRKGREKLTFFRLPLMGDPEAPDPENPGGLLPFKVTDICRKLISCMGFAYNQIDVPDSPIRFWPSGDGSGEDLLIDPLSEILEIVAGFLHDYLGWSLLWDGNAANGGARGMMRARPPAFAPYVNLAHFTLDRPAGTKFMHRPETYGSTNWVGSESPDDGPVTTWIRRRTLRTYTKAPEATAVIVTGTGNILPNNAGQYQRSNWAWNPKSFDFFRDADGNLVHSADQTNPDYMGEFIPAAIVNTSLPTQAAVDALTRRVYDQGCRAVKMAPFEAPLVLVWDWNDPYQIAPRPLRYYDPVQIRYDGVDTQFLVRSCNPHYNKDHVQMAYYELEAPNR